MWAINSAPYGLRSGIILLREGEVGDAEVPLIHDLHIDAESAEQGESPCERHGRTLSQPLIVVDKFELHSEYITNRLPVWTRAVL
jgi:hypothetical protein